MKDNLFDGIDRKALDDFLKEKINREIILKYLFIKSIEEKFEDEYIQAKYRINPKKIRREYNSLDKEKIASMEKDLRAKIEEKIIDLDSEAVRWHRESFQSPRSSETGKKGQEALKAKREENER